MGIIWARYAKAPSLGANTVQLCLSVSTNEKRAAHRTTGQCLFIGSYIFFKSHSLIASCELTLSILHNCSQNCREGEGMELLHAFQSHAGK